MKNYDKKKPLIAIHVPKAGGTSTLLTFKQWYGNKIYYHYYNEKNCKKPKKIRLKSWITGKYYNQICIYGHFNNNRGFGVQDYYPEVDQFVTIVRDPFELVVSEYFYIRKVGASWRDRSRFPADDLKTYLLKCVPNFLNHFPFELTLANYSELLERHFIYIGITEDLENSIKALARKLDFMMPTSVKWLNRTARDMRTPNELKSLFRQRHPVEYAVYEYAKRNYLHP